MNANNRYPNTMRNNFKNSNAFNGSTMPHSSNKISSSSSSSSFQPKNYKRKNSYHVIFSDIVKLRFNYLVTRFLATFTVLLLVVFSLLSKLRITDLLLISASPDSYVNKRSFILTTPISWFLAYVSLIIIYITKKNYLHVSFDVKKNKWKRIVKKTGVYFVLYFMSYSLLNLGISQINVLTNSQWFSRYFRILSLCIIPIVYTIQHVFMDLDRLKFNHGARHQLPQQYIFSRLQNSLQRSLIVSVFNSLIILLLHFLVLSPFLQLIFKSGSTSYKRSNNANSIYGNGRTMNYNNNQNNYNYNHVFSGGNSSGSSSSSSRFVSNAYSLPGVVKFFQYTVVNYIVFQIWDLCNISFNAYLSIGPLHKGRLISLLSENPIETLISGLKSEDNFTKLTAFQELSYRARIPANVGTLNRNNTNVYRSPIYANKKYWGMILKECFKVMNQTNDAVSNYTIKHTYSNDNEYNERINILKQQEAHRNQWRSQENDIIFGNRFSDNISSKYTSSPHQQSNNIYVPLREDNVDDIFLNSPDKDDQNDAKFYYQDPNKKDNNLISTLVLPYLSNKFEKLMKKFFFPDSVSNIPGESNISSNQKTTSLLSSNKKKNAFNSQKQAERLCPLPSIYAETVLSLTGFLINSYDEDPRSTCMNSISDVLKILENSISCLGGFVDCATSSLQSLANKDLHQKNQTTSISILYDVCVTAILELIMKYNDDLNDINLEDDVEKMVEWVSNVINN